MKHVLNHVAEKNIWMMISLHGQFSILQTTNYWGTMRVQWIFTREFVKRRKVCIIFQILVNIHHKVERNNINITRKCKVWKMNCVPKCKTNLMSWFYSTKDTKLIHKFEFELMKKSIFYSSCASFDFNIGKDRGFLTLCWTKYKKVDRNDHNSVVFLSVRFSTFRSVNFLVIDIRVSLLVSYLA